MRTAIVKRPPDVFGAPAFAWGRVALLGTVALGGALFGAGDGNSEMFFDLVTFAGVPMALVLLLTLGRLRPKTHALISAAVDVAAAISLHALVAQGAQVAQLAYVLIPAVAAISAGFLPAFVITLFGVAANAYIDLADAESLPGDFNPVVHVARFALATLFVYLVARATEDRRRAQASERAASVKAETILAKVSSAVVVTDPRGRLIEWNDAAAGVLAPADDLTDSELTCGRLLNLYVDGNPLDCSAGCGLLRLRRENPEHDTADVCRHLPDGRRQPLIADAAAITGPDGETLEVVHSILDVTRLKQADEAKTLFLATASHELKTPLTVISGFAELLLSMPDLPDTQRTHALETIRRRTAELASIVDRLLLSSRIEAGKVQVNLEPVEVESLVRERVESLASATGREFRIAAGREVPPAEADSSAVTTIVDHLLENAIRYSPEGDRVDVAVRRDDDAVEISITDRGIGMDPQQQERCFDRFWQAESTDVRRFGGTGIGLYIVKSLTEAIGGTVTVASRLGRGTTFTVRLPKSTEIDLSGKNGASRPHLLDELESPSAGGSS